MSFYEMVLLLHQEAEMLPLQMKLVSEEKLKRYQRKTYKKLQKKIFAVWQEFEEGDRTAKQLLAAISNLYGPTISVRV